MTSRVCAYCVCLGGLSNASGDCARYPSSARRTSHPVKPLMHLKPCPVRGRPAYERVHVGTAGPRAEQRVHVRNNERVGPRSPAVERSRAQALVNQTAALALPDPRLIS